MKIIVNQKELLKAIQRIKKVENLVSRLYIKNNQIKISGINFENNSELINNLSGKIIDESNNLLLIGDLKLIEKIVKGSLKDNITIEYNSSKLLIDNKSIVFDNDINTEKITIAQFKQNKLKEILTKIKFSISPDEKIVNSLSLDIGQSEINIIACDGYRMSIFNEQNNDYDSDNYKISIAKNDVDVLYNSLCKKPYKTIISIDNEFIYFESQNWIIKCKILKNDFIKYKSYIPDNKCEIEFERKELLNILSTIINNQPDYIRYPVKLSIKDNIMNVSYYYKEGEKEVNINDNTDIYNSHNLSFQAAYNPRFLMEVLKNINDDKITILYPEEKQNINPILIKTENYTYMILPVRI